MSREVCTTKYVERSGREGGYGKVTKGVRNARSGIVYRKQQGGRLKRLGAGIPGPWGRAMFRVGDEPRCRDGVAAPPSPGREPLVMCSFLTALPRSNLTAHWTAQVIIS